MDQLATSSDRRPVRALALVLLASVAACAEEPAPPQSAGAPESPASFQVPEVQPGSGTGESGIRWTVPEGWIEERPSSTMRRAQYRVPGKAEGSDAEVVVFYFGPGQGGDAQANAQRWASQFTDGQGRPSGDFATEQLQVGGRSVLRVETRGTYRDGMRMGGGASQSFPGYMLLGAIVQGPDANWFFKLTGPEATVTENSEAFDGLLQSLTPGQ